jgi:hypothetical protein
MRPLLAKRRKRSTEDRPTQAGDIGCRRHDSEVRSWPFSDLPTCLLLCCYRGISGHQARRCRSRCAR